MVSEYETVADIVSEMRQAEATWHRSEIAQLPTQYLNEWSDRIEAAHQREVAELKSKMNDVVCENEALRDACGTCGARREREATREKKGK